jgi:hypothetical protein
MRCPRCNGLMYMTELRDSRVPNRSVGFACILCGDIVDPTIMRNRMRAPGDLLQARGTRVRRRRFRRVFMG